MNYLYIHINRENKSFLQYIDNSFWRLIIIAKCRKILCCIGIVFFNLKQPENHFYIDKSKESLLLTLIVQVSLFIG